MSKATTILTGPSLKLQQAREQLEKANEKREDAIAKLVKANAAVFKVRKLVVRRYKAKQKAPPAAGKVRITPPAKPLAPAAPLA